MSLTRREFLGCTVGMIALAGCINESTEVRVFSGRGEPVTTNVRIATVTSEEPLVDERVTVKPPGSDDYAAEYDIQTGQTYQLTVNTEDSITDDYRWNIPSNASHRSLAIVIEKGEIKFMIETAD